MSAGNSAEARRREDAESAKRFRTMLVYFVIVQGIMLGATGQWRDIPVGAHRMYSKLTHWLDVELAALHTTSPSELLASLLSGKTLVMPSMAAVAEYLYPRLILLTICAIVAVGIRIAFAVARNQIPNEGVSFAKAVPVEVAGKKND